jgi:hypothetical protein
MNEPSLIEHEDEINRLANDLAGEWRERAEKAEAEITVWKTRLVEETARLRDLNRGAVEALEHIAESADHPSLTVRSTSYLGKVARDALTALRGQS